jgi:hypothetical protein
MQKSDELLSAMWMNVLRRNDDAMKLFAGSPKPEKWSVSVAIQIR